MYIQPAVVDIKPGPVIFLIIYTWTSPFRCCTWTCRNLAVIIHSNNSIKQRPSYCRSELYRALAVCMPDSSTLAFTHTMHLSLAPLYEVGLASWQFPCTAVFKDCVSSLLEYEQHTDYCYVQALCLNLPLTIVNLHYRTCSFLLIKKRLSVSLLSTYILFLLERTHRYKAILLHIKVVLRDMICH